MENITKSNGKTLLLIDDEPFILDMYGTKLAMEGYEVLKSTSGVEAWQTIKDKKPDLIFLDLLMGEENGFTTLERIKEHKDPAIANIPVIILTNLDDHDSQERCSRLGCLYFLVKPKHVPSDLVDIANELLF